MTGGLTVCDCCPKVAEPDGSPVTCREVELAARGPSTATKLKIRDGAWLLQMRNWHSFPNENF
jgi:hypothetical protein